MKSKPRRHLNSAVSAFRTACPALMCFHKTETGQPNRRALLILLKLNLTKSLNRHGMTDLLCRRNWVARLLHLETLHLPTRFQAKSAKYPMQWRCLGLNQRNRDRMLKILHVYSTKFKVFWRYMQFKKTQTNQRRHIV